MLDSLPPAHPGFLLRRIAIAVYSAVAHTHRVGDSGQKDDRAHGGSRLEAKHKGTLKGQDWSKFKVPNKTKEKNKSLFVKFGGSSR